MSNDNQNTSPETDKQVQAIQTPSVEPKPVVPATKELPDKYKGKAMEDVVEMHINAERKVSELGSEVSKLSKQIDELQSISTDNSDKDAFYEDPYAKVSELEKQNQKLALSLTIFAARQDEKLPKWKEYESEILKVVNEKQYLLNDPNWTETVYTLVKSTREPEEFKKAEELKKQMEEAEKIKKQDVPIVVDSDSKTPPPPPKKTIKEKIAEARKNGSISDVLIDDSLLTDRERSMLS